MSNNMATTITTTDAFTAKVVVIVPTYERSAFIPNLLRCFAKQTYPANLLSMIILDDSPSTEPTLRAIQSFPDPEVIKRVTYLYYPTKLSIGDKRNRLNTLALESGAEYIACMDDDDYYFADRIAYTIQQMRRFPTKLIAGCNTALVYFPLALQKEMENATDGWRELAKKDASRRIFAHEILFRSPTIGNAKYVPGNICNASMVYHRDYLLTHSYDISNTYGEEKEFLRGFKEEVIHLPSDRIFVCIAHGHNTVEKYSMTKNFQATLLRADLMIDDSECMMFYRGGKKEEQVISENQYIVAITQVIEYQQPYSSESTNIFNSVFPSLSSGRKRSFWQTFTSTVTTTTT